MVKTNCPIVLTVVTRTVLDTLAPDALERARRELMEKSRVKDPDNPGLWTVQAAGRELWGILDKRAGPDGEDVLTILFPWDY